MGNKAAHDEMLTEEELAALADDEAGEDPSEAAPAEDVATAQEAEAAKEGETDASGEVKQEDAKAEVEPEATSQADAQKAETPVADPTPDPEPAAAAQPDAAAGDDDIAKSIPQMTWHVPADYPEKIAAGEKTLDELAEKFDNGELLASEYRQQARAVQSEIDNLKKIVDRAETREEDAKQSWYEACEEFIGKNPAYASPGPMRQMLDAEVRRLQENLGARGRNYLHASVLEIAASNIKRSAAELLGVQVSNDTQAKPQGKNPAPAPKAPAAVVKPQTKEPVPTLSAVPVTAEDDIESGEFAYLNRLSDKDWPAYERELEKLQRSDPEKYNAYMAYMN